MAYIVMACMAVAYIAMACIAMAHIVMTDPGMTCIVMAPIVMVPRDATGPLWALMRPHGLGVMLQQPGLRIQLADVDPS